MSTHYYETEKDVHDATVLDGDEKPVGKVKEVHTTSVALAAAIASQKPKLTSTNMIKLYMIMSVGYLVSTMNGFGTLFTSLLANFILPPVRTGS